MNLKILRKSASLTQRELAEKVGIPKTTYAHYESGRRESPHTTLIKIADFFGCSIDYLLGHQTKGLIYVNDLTETQASFIQKLIALDDSTINKLEGALIRIEEENSNPWLARR